MRQVPPAILQDGADVLLDVQVQPRASRNQVILTHHRPTGPGTPFNTLLSLAITIRLTAPPVAGRANAACCAFLAELLGLPKARVAIDRGATGRHKLLRIRGAQVAAILARLQGAA